ncbi:MAG: PhzF family phenazine biosynthesis protein [Desulfuromusa sp.]|nr:PhzF family phenazine biosynthesis protein [Desulfuromusa sp.]
MRTLRFKKIDAFASTTSSGNPAAVVYLDTLSELSQEEMLQIAKELQGFVSEVGFVSPGKDTDYQLRYFSSEREVAFCGHATIAILNDIVVNNESMQEKTMLSIATQTDRLLVENRFKKEKSVYISAPPPKFSMKKIDMAQIAPALNCQVNDLDKLLPVRIINGGLETLVVPMTGLDSILSVTPDLQILNDFCTQIGVDIIILYSSETTTQDCNYRTRVFAPTFGYLEDPATGSGNAAFGYYLLKQDMWSGEAIKIEQNDSRKTPNYVKLFSKTTNTGDYQVWFGGGAVLRIDGHYFLSKENSKTA